MSEYGTIVKTRYAVELWDGARRVRVLRIKEEVTVDGAGPIPSRKRGGGKRGRIRGYTGKSLARLRDMYDTLRPEQVARGIAITLTYPEGLGVSPSQVHIDLVRFGRWFMRAHPEALVVWVLA